MTRFTEWVLIDGDRIVLTISSAAIVFVLLLGLHEVGYIASADGDSLTRLASGMIAGTFSLVTLVVSINQLILSREFQAAGEIRRELEDTLSFRGDIGDISDVATSPAAPSEILGLLLETIHDRASTIAADGTTRPDDEAAREVDAYLEDLQASTATVIEVLDEAKFGTVNAVSVAIGYRDNWHLYAALRLRNKRADVLSDRAERGFDELIEALQLFAVAREHLKTTYLQRELTRFSRLTIVCGIPAVGAAILLGLIYGTGEGSTVPASIQPTVVSGLITLVFLPLLLLGFYILRSATIARRTASIGPILPEKDPDEGVLDDGSSTSQVDEASSTD